MTETVTLLRPHLRNTCFAVVQCGNLWKLRLLADDRTVRQEAIPSSFAEALIETVSAGVAMHRAENGIPSPAESENVT